jgi:hypothetical protein
MQASKKQYKLSSVLDIILRILAWLYMSLCVVYYNGND